MLSVFAYQMRVIKRGDIFGVSIYRVYLLPMRYETAHMLLQAVPIIM